MLCYLLRINPFGHREDVVLYFIAPPDRREAMEALTDLIRAEHPAGASMLSRCVEAIDQHGIPKLEWDERTGGYKPAGFRWRLPTPPERWARIRLETFELVENHEPEPEENPKSEFPKSESSPNDRSPTVPTTVPTTLGELAVAQVALMRRLDLLKLRCRGLIDSIRAEDGAADTLYRILEEFARLVPD